MEAYVAYEIIETLIVSGLSVLAPIDVHDGTAGAARTHKQGQGGKHACDKV